MRLIIKNISDLERSFLFHMKVIAPELKPKREHRFHEKRRWRFDFAFVDKKIAVEIDGGTRIKKCIGGKHNSDQDREKLNEAAILGWRVLRFSGTMLRNDPYKCVESVCRSLKNEQK